MSLYRNILGQAWKITWKHKYLWFFGLFAAFLSSGGEYEILTQGLGNNPAQGTIDWFRGIEGTGIFSRQALSNIVDLAKNDTFSLAMVIIIFLIVLALAVFLIWLSVVSQAALVNNVNNHLHGKGGDIRGGMEDGGKKFWPVLALSLIMKIMVYAVFIVFGIPAIYTVSKSGVIAAGILYVLMFLAFAVIVLTFSFIIKYAIGYVVIKGNKTCESLKNSWRLFADNWIISLEMAVILFFISLAVTFAYFLVVLVFAIPFLLLGIIAVKMGAAVFLLVGFLALVFYIISLVFIGSTLSAFQISAWTALFVQLIGKGGESKIVRVINGLLDK